MRDVEVLTPKIGGPTGCAGFASKGTPGGPGACLWCGAKLRAPKAHLTEAQRAGARGDYADNAFCGLRCGYSFGLQLALFGRRLEVAREQVTTGTSTDSQNSATAATQPDSIIPTQQSQI